MLTRGRCRRPAIKFAGIRTGLLAIIYVLYGGLILGQLGCTGLTGASPRTSGGGSSPLLVTTTSLPNGTVGTSYSATVTANGGTTPYTWSLASGSSLPAGLTLAASTGQISGMPSHSGTYSFTVQVADPGTVIQTATQAFTVTIAAAASTLTINTSSLPNGTVGASYSATVAASGGTIPYTWSLASGSSLPAGLVLSATTGQITGTPTQSGSFSFSIHAADSSTTPQSATQSYTVTVASAASPLTISTSSLPNGTTGTNYAQSLTATGGTIPYTWSLFSGALPQGLTLAGSTGVIAGVPTQPGSYSFTIQVKDSATNAQTASQAFGITVSAGALQISNNRLPSGLVGTTYSVTLTATGGLAPYSWSVLAGLLPAGLALSPQGAISGVPITALTSAFQIQVQDSAGTTASANLTISVLAAGSCGGPITYCSRTDTSVAQLPSTLPSVGGLTGAGTIVTEPEFGNSVVRVTDANTDPQQADITTNLGTAGSADENVWNTDSTLFVTGNTHGHHYIWGFDPSTMAASRLYVSSFPATNGMELPGMEPFFSRANSQVVYGIGGAKGTSVVKYDFTDRANPPSLQTLYDFTSSVNCLPSGFSPSWSAPGGGSGGDTAFGAGFSNTGGQGTGVYVVAYKVGSGCRVWNTQTGQVTGDWGTVGTISLPDRITIHNAKISKDGNWMIVVSTNCTSGTCSTGPYFWQIGTTNVYACGSIHCEGHWTEGYGTWANGDPNGGNCQAYNETLRNFSTPGAFSYLTPPTDCPPQTMPTPHDEHTSWNNVDSSNSNPIFSSHLGAGCNHCTMGYAWEDEITATSPTNGVVWRFAHTYNTQLSQRFDTTIAVGTVSQDGRFFMWSSDWMGTLGSESGASACTLGTDCRGDVFIVKLH